MNDKPSKISNSKKRFQLLTDYLFRSDEKLIAWLLVIGTIITILAVLGLSIVLTVWISPALFAALVAKDLALFFTYLGISLLTATVCIGINGIGNYFKSFLGLKWRSWLTSELTNEYIDNKNYLELSRKHQDIDSPEQRIEEDVETFVDSTIELSFGFLDNAMNLAVFVGVLWVIGGTLSFAVLGLNIVIPGYLVWGSLIAALTASIVMHVIGKALTHAKQSNAQLSSDLRQDIEHLRTDAENIAIEKAEEYYQERIDRDMIELTENSNKKALIETVIDGFRDVNLQIQNILPYVLAAPTYFTGLIDVDQVFSIGVYFSKVSTSLNWFVDSYETISDFNASANRIMELQSALEDAETTRNQTEIKVSTNPSINGIVVKDVKLTTPKEGECISKGINLTFEQGVSTIIKAPSGYGKSTLFKAIAGTWKTGEGQISTPTGQSLYFLPQKPTLPDDTLRNILSYPNSDCSYSDLELTKVLNQVNLSKWSSKLDEKLGSQLCGGEQQRVAYARVLLKKPDWVFLDEVTSSLDEENEELVYTLIQKELPKTTFISIAHRSTVEKYHKRIMFFSVDEEKNVTVDTKEVSGAVVFS